MKSLHTIRPFMALCLAGLAASVHAQQTTPVPAPVPAPATTVTEERTTTAVLPDPNLDKIEGKVQRIEAEKNQLMVRTKHADAPIPYNMVSATKFIDLDGKPFSPKLLEVDVPVEVRYVKDGDQFIASTVIVQRIQAPLPGGGVTLTMRETLKPGGKVIAETVKTTSVSQSGTLRNLEPGVITVAAEGQAHPLRYQYTEKTTWVDSQGQPVPMTVLKSGYPIKVNYSKRGDTMFADQVIVSTPATVPATPQVPASVPENP